MISIRIPTPPLSNYLFSSTLKPAFLLGVAGVSSVGLASNVSGKNTELNKKLQEIVSKANVIIKPVTSKLGKGITELFGTLSDWSKTAINKTEGWSKKAKEYLKLDQLQNGSRTMFTTLNGWGSTALEAFREYYSKIQEFDWKKIKEWIAKHGEQAINLLSILKNIFDAKGGDALLITKLFEAMGQEDFGKFASSIGNLIQKQPKVLDELGSDDVGNILDAFSAKPKETVEIIDKMAENSTNKGLGTKDLVGALKLNSLEKRAKLYLEKAKSMQSKTKETVNQEELKNTLKGLQEVLQEIQRITERAKSK
ncbi:hypothetical protein A6V39_00970 [Candidatus Mycoplasma haematobovis]|uniref:Uncharacterized protein n=1 Tax=Candidatus Mycoplasma haematobovis TaxID=432608 RepID=A0A1A9QER5_9MOLU|nr:hypothetical protein [Candidatus Mycoplasma haematobovis]OAL10624.1 hypothetical protein A6V39_00970 [Candidatus Mycoplasma haematobovis]